MIVAAHVAAAGFAVPVLVGVPECYSVFVGAGGYDQLEWEGAVDNNEASSADSFVAWPISMLELSKIVMAIS